jgi:CubicO group peptidase (beta-lactamase class C family)/uncharacterized protein YjaZ
VYRIGSDTKQFTAAAIMRLVEQGKLHLDDDVRPFFLNFPFGGRHVTVRQLLTHTSGVANYTVHLADFERENLPHDSLLAKIYDKPFDFEPGTSYRYSNTGYYMLGMIVEKLSGRSYKDYLQQEFLTPLGLSETYYCNVEPLIEHRVPGYGVKDGKFVNADYIDMDLPFAAGSLCSTPSDLIGWSRALAGGKVVGAASYQQMTTPVARNAGAPPQTGNGFGLMISGLGGHRQVAHGGSINGFIASVTTFPDDSLYVVVLTNVRSPEGRQQLHAVVEGLSRFALGLPPAPPAAPRKPRTNAAATPLPGPVIHTEDVTAFYKLYNATHGHPTAEQLQRDYLDPGSDGLHRLAKERRVTGASIAEAMTRHPEMYANAERCMTVLPQVSRRLKTVFRNLATLYPEAQFPPVTIAISRAKPIAIADASGVIIGLNNLCAVTWMNPNVEDRFVHVIAHEYTHVQQALAAPALFNKAKPTVLEQSLVEGAADFSAELISGEAGEIANSAFTTRTKGHEAEIETAFAADEDKTDLSKWFGNSTLTKAGDLGYWVGYRIAKSYYEHARDKCRAFRDIIQMTDAKAFLAKSGWYPGIRLEKAAGWSCPDSVGR